MQKSKKFDGILIASDFDGTLSDGGVPQVSIDAIDHFIDNGGMFTVITGRGGENLLMPDIMTVPKNVIGAGSLGAEIYDYERRVCVKEFNLPPEAADVMRGIVEYYGGTVARIRLDAAEKHTWFGTAAEDIEKAAEAARADKLTKIILILDRDYTPEEFDVLREMYSDRCSLSSNGTNYLELTAIGINKGSAARYLRDTLSPRLLVCAGDSRGDIPMLEEADIGYAVANAMDEAKSAADRVTRATAGEGAIAEIIAELERGI